MLLVNSHRNNGMQLLVMNVFVTYKMQSRGTERFNFNLCDTFVFLCEFYSSLLIRLNWNDRVKDLLLVIFQHLALNRQQNPTICTIYK